MIRTTLLAFGMALALGVGPAMAGEIPDAPLEPSVSTDEVRLVPGVFYEYWFHNRGTFVKIPVDPAIGETTVNEEQVFSTKFMEKTPEMKDYVRREGVVRGTAYLRIRKPGKHVFIVQLDGGRNHCDRRSTGVKLFVNNEPFYDCGRGELKSFTIDFAAPGFYKFVYQYWQTDCDIDFTSDARTTIKMREPGASGARILSGADFFTPARDEE